MRVTIELDESKAPGTAAHTATEATDGGVAPAGDGSTFSASGEIDGGGPAQSLLEAIAAAEAEGATAGLTSTSDADAGAGPSDLAERN